MSGAKSGPQRQGIQLNEVKSRSQRRGIQYPAPSI
jgi:hypothetical protein